jgi:hypothetical protein
METIFNIILGAGDVDGVLSDDMYGQILFAYNMTFVTNKCVPPSIVIESSHSCFEQRRRRHFVCESREQIFQRTVLMTTC